MLYFYRRVAVILGLIDSHVIKKLDCLRAESNLLRFFCVIVKKSKTFSHVDDVFDLSRISYIKLQMSTTFSILNVYLHVTVVRDSRYSLNENSKTREERVCTDGDRNALCRVCECQGSNHVFLSALRRCFRDTLVTLFLSLCKLRFEATIYSLISSSGRRFEGCRWLRRG